MSTVMKTTRDVKGIGLSIPRPDGPDKVTGTPMRIRTDLSATLFLSEPDEYDGGELVVEDTYGVHSVKLPI